MKKLSLLFVCTIGVLITTAYSCNAQNGPTQQGPPSATLNWTQSVTSGITGNCVYRGSIAGTYALPAIFCSTAPITSYKDTTVVRGQTYHYAVTAQTGTGATLAESVYSNDVTAVIPPVLVLPAAPSGLATGLIAKNILPTLKHKENDFKLVASVK